MIEIEGLQKTFSAGDNPTAALKDVSLSIKQGEIFGIIGRSGAGKSTLVRCINLLERPSAGRISVNGREISSLSGAALREARREIGMIFQHFNLLSSRTVFDNVAFPLELAGRSKAEIAREVTPLLDLVGLTDKRDRYPSELSGGQKQRVGIARALASKPAVLLCDEATSALDPETTKSILALLRDINRKLGLTIVLITHEMPVIKEICDRVAVLDQGSVVEQGTVFEIFTAPQAEITRRFVSDVIDRPLPSMLIERLQATPLTQGNVVLRIVFTGPTANSPIISEVVQRYGVLLNILQGNVEYIQGAPYGNIVVEAVGQPQAVQEVIDHIRDNNLRVEVLGHVADAHRAVA
ncbi:methionine ABC transporter ATP-binding protein [Telmatospirillum siberiense]|uniref:Cell division ATP-binding protein FtsE n=1 Tax=Telmatospirillum siberiense TaxID=382514 RepID=A0A2N3PYL4_9PROT|nr:methionine ABC transporter ATP-binding protein [Telmatospirillum siberiense]PKU25502.1 methionine ABC transporter ATP-binding protein [Telmatospirillum siberiense]